ncbi:MAG: hypothetical protein WBB67_06280 [bacterium]
MKNAHSEDNEIKRLMLEGDKRSYSGRLERLRFLLSIEDQEPFPTSALASEYYEEMRLCWYVGAFVAAIVMAQLAFEELLRSHYRVAKGIGGKLNCDKKVDNASFYDLIEEAKNDKWISGKEAKLLHSLRKNVRNPYVHVKDIKLNNKGRPNLKKDNFFNQFLMIKAPGLLGSDVETEAKKTIQLVITLFPEISRRYGGL